MSIRKWLSEKLAEWAYGGVLTVILASVVAFLKHYKSEWADPALYGALVFLVGGLCCCGLVVVARTPRLRTRISVDTAERFIRDWLHNCGASVKNAPTAETCFRLSVQLPGGAQVIVGRPRSGMPDHIIFRAELVWESNLPPEWQNATQKEQERLLDLIKLELARARVGYSGLQLPITDCFAISKSIRVTDSLHEDSFMAIAWDIEAAVNATAAIYSLWAKSLPVK